MEGRWSSNFDSPDAGVIDTRNDTSGLFSSVFGSGVFPRVSETGSVNSLFRDLKF